MKKYVSKGRAEGVVCPPPSKSVAHRLLICAAMCQGESRIEGIPSCEDVLATIDCLRALGVKIEYDGSCAIVSGIDFTKAVPSGPLNCRESGSTLRFLIPLAMLSGNEVKFIGSERLMARPQTIYETIAKEEGLTFKRESDSITVCGPLRAGEFFIDGNVSSQFITGLLLALSTMSGDTKIIFNTPIESRPYVELTVAAMAMFKVRVFYDTDWSFFIFGGQEYQANNLSVEGDWSGAAFIEALNHIGGRIIIEGVSEDSLQGDKICREYFSRLDSGFCELDISNCPDLGPILFTVAAMKDGARFTGTRRLRDKESDRIAAMKCELEKFGAELIVDDNSVTVRKRELHAPTESLYSHNDHRIVMSLAVLCTLYGGEICGCEAVSKSYPDFFKDLLALGIKVYDIE
jgi:3-phosphoshikimate 1-carboxyvinyltransferase